MGFQEVVDAVVDHMLEFLLFVDHIVLLVVVVGRHRLVGHIYFLNFLVQTSRIVRLGPRCKGTENCVHYVLVIKEILLIALV